MDRKWFLLFVVLILGITVGCDSKYASKHTINAKWDVGSDNEKFSSFEFTVDDIYIVIENLVSVHTGKYRIEKSNIILEGLGVLEVISINPKEFIFSFKLEKSNEKIEYHAVKMENTVAKSSKTNMLCRFWKVDNVSNPSVSSQIGTTVLFSRAGTYLVTQDGITEVSEWKWGNKEETVIHYSWDKWNDNWLNNNKVIILDLSVTRLKMLEHDIIWELVLGQ
jgi:hypothetical protein